MSMHNTASLVFVAAAVVHVVLNWKVLTHYMSARVGEYGRFKRELLIAVLGRVRACTARSVPCAPHAVGKAGARVV
jgi:hypothetical protein